MKETDGRKGVPIPCIEWTQEPRTRYGAFVDVRDPDFHSLRKGLDHAQAQIEEVADKIDMDTLAHLISAAYDPLRQELIIRLSWTARGKEEDE